MKARKLLVIFATVHGQSALIADRIADEAIESGAEAMLRDLRDTSREDVKRCVARVGSGKCLRRRPSERQG